MTDDMLMYLMVGVVCLLLIIVIAYLIIRKRLQKSDVRKIQQLRAGTQKSQFSSDIIFQRLYLMYRKVPLIKRYLLKLRRRLEIVNLDDEYLTRKQASTILTKALCVILPVTILIILLTNSNVLLMFILLIFEIFILDTIIDGMVDKIDNNLLKQQINLFTEIRHAYHEFNMVEEAIYQVAQDDELEVSIQAQKIYEILISDDPETELEKYYDVAPNIYLKEFAGVSYLTKEFGDRKVDGASLYLKNLNNITQEMQLEILKRDKLDYVFQSLAVISVVPMLFLEVIKNWSVSQFSFTRAFYYGKGGFIVQILIILVTFICYTLTRKLKDNGSVDTATKNYEHPWQEKVYNKKTIGAFVNMFMPKERTKEYRKLKDLMKRAATKLKLEWLYVNKLTIFAVTFLVSLLMFSQLHNISINYIYTNPTTDYDILGNMSESDEQKAMEVTESDNKFLDKFRGKTKTTQEDIEVAMKYSEDYENATDEEIATAAERVFGKLQVVNAEYFKWFELLLAIVFALVGYVSPNILLFFQVKMRELEMENEVMQFQTIILMLMRIERVNVEIILEWLERYSNIFKGPISKCVNNYEAGAWEALEVMKEEVAYEPMIRIIESLQAAVEKIPIIEAFDELETEKDYYKQQRKESNERLISRKGLIGKAIGFAPLVCVFVGYLIVPLVVIGLTSMSSTFETMSNMQ